MLMTDVAVYLSQASQKSAASPHTIQPYVMRCSQHIASKKSVTLARAQKQHQHVSHSHTPDMLENVPGGHTVQLAAVVAPAAALRLPWHCCTS